MWMRTADDGLAAVLYGPSSVDTKVKGVEVQIEESTDYPFSETISLRVSPRKPVEFPLELRNPQWSKSTQVVCAGANVSKNGDYFLVRKRWTEGDQVKIVFTESIMAIHAWPAEIALQRGPLVYALTIPAVKTEFKHYGLTGFADLEYSSAMGAQWWYALDPRLGKEDFGFTASGDGHFDTPYPFDGSPVRLEGKLINLVTKQTDDVHLVPMGSNEAILRRVTFPVAAGEAK
jgi:hypothetical protein